MIDTERAEYERVIGELVAKVQELVAANERLTSELTAHQTLRAIYSDSTQPATVRVRAAQAALNVEMPSLKPQEPAIDGTCEKYVPLAELITQRRAHVDAMQREARDIEVLRDDTVRVLPKPSGGNGSD